MMQCVDAVFSPVNLPLTILLGLVLIYWLVVIMGMADLDWAPDMDLDMDAPGGFLSSFIQAFNIGDIPVILIISILVFFLWSFSILSNRLLNPSGGFLMGAGLFIPNFIVSYLLTLGIFKIIGKMIQSEQNQDDETKSALYKVGKVITSRVDENFGQVEIETGGASIKVNARTTGDTILKKGEKAIIFDEDKNKGIFFVDRYSEE